MWVSVMCLTAVAIVTAADSVAVAAVVDSATVDTLINNVNAIVNAAKGMKVGDVTIWLLLAAVIKLLISLMKFHPVAKWLDTPKMKAVKPYIALALGLIGGFIASMATGQSVVVSLIAGATAGFGATGIHELFKSVRGKNV
jgi:hypothetical protein